LIRDNPGRPVPEETFNCSHPSWSTYFLYHLSPFAMVHGILFIQLTCLTVISDNLSTFTNNYVYIYLHTYLFTIRCITGIPLSFQGCRSAYIYRKVLRHHTENQAYYVSVQHKLEALVLQNHFLQHQVNSQTIWHAFYTAATIN